MANCNLDYIPPRLHQNEKPLIEEFSIGEFLFRRCSEEDLSNPYKKISIIELSHNRSLNDELQSLPEDVLFNIDPNNPDITYKNEVVCNLRIISLNGDNVFLKPYEQNKNDIDYLATLELIHDPLPCMYHHCVFRVTLNNELIDTYEKYNNTIKKLNKIRAAIKLELASMIYTRTIDQENDINMGN